MSESLEKIMPNRLDRGFYKYQKEFEDKALQVLRSGWYVLGPEVRNFEENFAKWTGAKYCVGLASGLDALWLAFRILGIGKGDEVLVQANTYIASVMGITMNGATPIFIEPDEYNNIDASKLEDVITSKTKAILVVHLYGQASNMAPIMKIVKKYNLKLVEDCAQSHGACFNGQMTGTFGDAGAIVTNNEKIAQDFKMYRNYGSQIRYYNKVVGANSRLDEMQAGLLNVRLSHIKELTDERIRLCEQYNKEIINPKIEKPLIREGATSVWHQYVIHCKQRDELIKFLNERNIGTIIHYPIPPHLQECYEYLGYKKGAFPITEKFADEVLSIPLYNGMTNEEQTRVIDAINEF